MPTLEPPALETAVDLTIEATAPALDPNRPRRFREALAQARRQNSRAAENSIARSVGLSSMDALIAAAAAEAEPQGDEAKAAGIVERKRQELQAAEAKLATENEARRRRESAVNRLSVLRQQLAQVATPEEFETYRKTLVEQVALELRGALPNANGIPDVHASKRADDGLKRLAELPGRIEATILMRAAIESEIRELERDLAG